MERSRTNHDRLWAAIDAIAARHGLSPSGLARRAGLDATAFNKSKRFTNDGRPRWPSTESIAKILAATGSELSELVGLIDARGSRLRATASAAGDGDPGFPGFRDEAHGAVPATGACDGHHSFVVADHRMMPVYRKGDVLIVSPDATIEPGDRVVLRIDGGTLEARVYLGHEPRGIVLAPLIGDSRDVIEPGRVSCFARILWVGQ